MNRQERAKQFMPFDALKGLQEELKKREEKHLREDKHILTEEEIEEICRVLRRLKKGDHIIANFYFKGHYFEHDGVVQRMSYSEQYIKTHSRRIHFEDILDIKILDD